MSDENSSNSPRASVGSDWWPEHLSPPGLSLAPAEGMGWGGGWGGDDVACDPFDGRFLTPIDDVCAPLTFAQPVAAEGGAAEGGGVPALAARAGVPAPARRGGPGRKQKYQGHSLLGHQRYPCKEPGCYFSTEKKYRLTDHQRTHSNERPFACPLSSCRWTAKTKSSIAAHSKTHDGDAGKKFSCSNLACQYKAVQSCDLKRHQKTCKRR